MIDWHSHILPAVDDGSKNMAESIEMLKRLAEQGVDTVVATPHFYANDESVEDFLRRRDGAYETLKREAPNAPEILLGAEVRYYQGIGRMENLDKLSIGESRLLLLEMPFSVWTEYTVRELVELSTRSDIKLCLAHIDRYLRLQKRSVWERLYESGILMQVNASFFTDFFTRRKALVMLCEGAIHFIGSDCHNLRSRPPRIGEAFGLIRRKTGEELLSQVNELGKALLEK